MSRTARDLRRGPARVITARVVALGIAWLVMGALLDTYGTLWGAVIGLPACLLAGWGAGAIVGELDARRDIARRERAYRCPTCNGVSAHGTRSRETVGMVCPTCGWDYARDGEP